MLEVGSSACRTPPDGTARADGGVGQGFPGGRLAEWAAGGVGGEGTDCGVGRPWSSNSLGIPTVLQTLQSAALDDAANAA